MNRAADNQARRPDIVETPTPLQGKVAVKFYQIGDIIFKDKITKPVGFVFKGTKFFSDPKYHQEYAASENIIQHEPEEFLYRKTLKWNEKLPSFPLPLNF